MTRRHAALPLHNLGCAGGATVTIEHALRHVPGVMRVYVNPVTEMAYVEYDQDRCDERTLTSELAREGYGRREAPHDAVPQGPPTPSRTPAPWHVALWSGAAFALSFLLGVLVVRLGGGAPLLLRAWDAATPGSDPAHGWGILSGVAAAFAYGAIGGGLAAAAYLAGHRHPTTSPSRPARAGGGT